MKNKKPLLPESNGSIGILAEIIKRFRLAWLLFTDQRVPIWTKTIPLMSWIYLFFPFDFIPDALLGIGQMDDLGIILLGMALFVKLCPTDIVQDHLDDLEYGPDPNDDDVIDANYRLIDRD